MAIRLEDVKHYKGHEVLYQPPGSHGRPERGIIQDSNDTVVFVLYLGDRVAKATYAEHLYFAGEGMQESYERFTERSNDSA